MATRKEQLDEVPLRNAQTKTWPKGIRSIGIEELDALGVDNDGQVYWHGKLIEIKKQLELHWWQAALAIGTALSAIVMGVLDVARYLSGGG